MALASWIEPGDGDGGAGMPAGKKERAGLALMKS